MTGDDLFGHLMGLLDHRDPQSRAIERRREQEPAFDRQLQRLRERLWVLLDDGPGPEPPRDLAQRAIRLVETYRQVGPMPTPARRAPEWAPARSLYRWADLAVAAGILIAGVLLLLPAVHRSRQGSLQLACVANLQQIGTALNRYATVHQVYPYPDPNSKTATNGEYATILHDGRLLTDTHLLVCPNAAIANPSLVVTPGGIDYPDASTDKPRPQIRSDYAYHRGVRPAVGRPSPVPALPASATIPLLSDQPPHDRDGRILHGNSPNHRGLGQNVLYGDGHAAFKRNRWMHREDTDLFLNQRGEPLPGIHARDASLGPAPFPIDRR